MDHSTSLRLPLMFSLLIAFGCDEAGSMSPAQTCEGAKCDDAEDDGSVDAQSGDATMKFGAIGVDAPIVAGGTLQIDYDLERLPNCRLTHNGNPSWDTVAHATFSPGGQEVFGSVREITLQGSPPMQVVVPRPFVVDVPADAEAVDLWFENWDATADCVELDDAGGTRYGFEVTPAGEGSGAATVQFPVEIAVTGELVTGGSLRIEYDLERLTTCRATHNGSPFWDITANVLFSPGNQHVERSVREITLEGSPPSQVVRPLPFEVEIPDDAILMDIWFRNFDGDVTCEDFDNPVAGYRITSGCPENHIPCGRDICCPI
jgi:hypothetical protein